jgi:hypothetical protein
MRAAHSVANAQMKMMGMVALELQQPMMSGAMGVG